MDVLATAMGSLGDAFALILQPQALLYLVMGVTLGLAVGVFPGLGGIAGLSLILPFVFGMDTVSGLALMVGMVAVVPTSDTFASVLMGIPGSTASQATVLDGFPLAKRGEAARALSAAFAASLFGGLVGAAFLTFFILVARPIVLAFGLPEMLLITVFGLSMVAIMAGRVPLKGVAAAGLGLLVGTIGEAAAGGSMRMATYDVPYLIDGVQLVIVGLGIFAIPEIIDLLRRERAIAGDAALGAGWTRGVRDWAANKWLSLRCALIGVTVGVVPGLGGSVVDWIAYGHTVQSSKERSGFGSGDIRGVIGPESSNNAKEGGGLVPTLVFGIPGSGSMAIFMGAVTLLGTGDIEMGPRMLSPSYLDITYSIVWLLALANVVGTVMCIALSGQIAKLTTIPFTLLAPFLFMLIAFAAFQSGQSLGDLVALFGLGLLGILLKRFEWSRPAFLIGFVLSAPAEAFGNQAYQIAGARFRQSWEAGFDYLVGPITVTLMIVIVVSLWLGIRQTQAIHTEGEVRAGGRTAPLVFAGAVALYAAVALWNADGISDRLMMDKFFPLLVGAVTLVAALVLFVQILRAPRGDTLLADGEATADAEGLRGFWGTLAWFAGLLAGCALVGFIAAIAVFLVAFLRVRAGASWGRAAGLTAAGVLFVSLLAGTLNRDFPAGLLQDHVSMPWPVGTDRTWYR